MKRIILILALLFACGCTKKNEETPPPPSSAVSSAEAPAPTHVPEAEPTAQPAAPVVSKPVPEPAETEKPAPTPAPPIHAGVYLFESEEYGTWRLNIKENGTFSLISGESIYNGEGWSDTGFGTVVTGPTEAAGRAPFFDEFGSSEWRIEGENCSPAF